MIQLDRPTAPQVAIPILIWNLFCFLKSWDGRKDEQALCVKNSDHYQSFVSRNFVIWPFKGQRGVH